jgi:hypothetical protein
VQEAPPVEVIRTVSAVTAPLLAAGPNALTQSPTARSVAAAVCVALTVVEFEVVSLRVCVFGVGGRFEPLELFELLELVARKVPGEMLMPDTVTVEPLTAVTLPEAMAKLPSRLRNAPPKFLGGLPLLPARDGKPPPPSPGRN